MNQNESVAFLQWLEGVVEYNAASDRFTFQGKSYKRKGQAQKAARKYWKEVYSEFFSQMGIIGSTVSGDPAQLVSIDESNRHN
ncbi:hypothetical protein CPM16_003159 [Escherichia coli]|nr:hypothetical protein [Escherichia coli]